MKRIEELKQDYNSLTPSPALRARVEKQLQGKKRHKWITGTCAAAAALIVTFTVSINVSPAFASTCSSIPVLGSVVQVLTGFRYDFSDGMHDALIKAPKIEGLSDKNLEKTLNDMFEKNAQQIYESFHDEISGLEDGHLGVTYSYDIKTDTDKFLVIDLYFVNTVGSSSTTHQFFTIDKRSNTLVTLADLCKAMPDYSSTLSKYIKSEMQRRNQEESGMFFLNDFTTISPDQNFYINDSNQLVLCFDKYEIAAGAQGCPEFVISSSLISIS